jgi:hypothetical protein
MLLDSLRRPLGTRRLTRWLAPLLLATLAVACEPVPLLSPDGSHIFLQGNPPFIIANGGRCLLTAVLTEPAGTYVPDGTQVFFFTDLGSVDERASTVNGVARAYLVSDSRSGHAHVRAFTGGAAPDTANPPDNQSSNTGEGSAAISISIGNALPKLVIVTADPQRIVSPRHASIVANVFDASGNPVQNVPVLFSVEANSSVLEETLDSGGSPRYTDSNGQAFDTLSTRRLATDPQKSVTVTATVPAAPDNKSGSVIVFVN